MANSAANVRLFLVGPMGSGKSTVGRHLADLLDCPFIDSDAEVESRAGADIPWIFDVEGEVGFRRLYQVCPGHAPHPCRVPKAWRVKIWRCPERGRQSAAGVGC